MPYLQNIEYHILNDGFCRVDGGGAFGLVPRVIWEQLLPPDEKNRVLFALRCLLIRSEGKTILVDTGYGRKLSEKMRQNMSLDRSQGDLLDQLSKLGVEA